MPKPPDNTRDFNALRYITECLRGEEGCPWDKEQTHKTLTRFAIEEAHELAEAIDSGDPQEIKSELGDVLFQVLLHSEIAKQQGSFTLEDVIQTLVEKMVRRHPHVFSNRKVESSTEVLQNWAEIKQQENPGLKKKTLFETPKGLPSLIEAFKIGEKTNSAGFDWSKPSQVIEKVEEEFTELKDAILSTGPQDQTTASITHEIGDLLFSVAQLARHLSIDPEQALRAANRRFRSRFQSMLEIQNCSIEDFRNLSSDQKEELWSKAKHQEQVREKS